MDTFDRIRAFNRFYIRQMGLVGQVYQDEGLSFSEVRVLFEIGQGTGPSAREIARNLALDEGYLSRVLKRFQSRGWVRRTQSDTDARRFDLSLTPVGQGLLTRLVDLSRQGIGTQLAHLQPAAQDGLATLLERAQAMIDDTLPPVTYRDLAPGDAGWLVQRHAELYARDEGFDASFEALVARILADFIDTRDPAMERAWIAHRGEERLGSIFCVKGDAPGVAKLRLFLLEPVARGQRLGLGLLTRCLGFARDKGYGKIQLWTHESHRAAGRLYAANGFTLTGREAKRSFGQDVVAQYWERAL